MTFIAKIAASKKQNSLQMNVLYMTKIKLTFLAFEASLALSLQSSQYLSGPIDPFVSYQFWICLGSLVHKYTQAWLLTTLAGNLLFF